MKLSDEWQTPDWLFEELNREFNFDIDLCATKENSKCNMYCTDYLNNRYQHKDYPFKEDGNIIFTSEQADPSKHGIDAYNNDDVTGFMNPPYSNPKPFIEKAWEDSKHCKIVCLVKCDPSTRWWATFWNYTKTGGPMGWQIRYAGPKPGCEVRFFPKRIKFEHPSLSGKSGPTFPCALIIMDRRGI